MGVASLFYLQLLLVSFLQVHFESMCNGRFGLKEETKMKMMKAKIRNIRNMLRFLVDNTDKTSVPDLIQEIDVLGHVKDGYFQLNPKADAAHEISDLQGFIDFLDGTRVLQREVSYPAKLKLANLRSNLTKLSAVRRAKFKESERDMEVTARDLQKFYTSPVIQECQKLLEEKPDLITVKKRTVIKLRNYLMFLLIERNMLRKADLFYKKK